MSLMKNEETVRDQYRNRDNLETRISLHRKYSTNREGFGNWVFRQLPELSGLAVLELGCGTGELWEGRSGAVAGVQSLVLSDFSEGMVRAAQEKTGDLPRVEYRVINAQDIPFPRNSFDLIIANHMLYHVPELNRVLGEIKRVLRPAGCLYSSTFGEGGFVAYVNGKLGSLGNPAPVKSGFTMQNGAPFLERYFTSVTRLDYEDTLRISEAGDLADYILSLASFAGNDMLLRDELKEELENDRNRESFIVIPKEAGLFISRKEDF